MARDAGTRQIITAALEALPGIVAALDPKDQPAGGSWVACSVHGPPSETEVDGLEIHHCWYTWRHDEPLEPLDEATYLLLTRDPETGVIKVPVWAFRLTPLGNDEWGLGYWFAAPLRMWMGEKAGDRVRGYGVTYVARRRRGRWELEFDDIVAG